jgi:hypothetical protein
MTMPQNALGKPSPNCPGSQAGEASDLQAVALALEMQSASTLLTVLTTVARLGCRATAVHATEGTASLDVLAPRRVAHRLLPCLAELIEVLAVTEVPAALPGSAGHAGA